MGEEPRFGKDRVLTHAQELAVRFNRRTAGALFADLIEHPPAAHTQAFVVDSPTSRCGA